MTWKKLILLNMLLLIIGAFAIIWGTDYMRERQVIQDEKRRLDLYDKILDGASTGPTQMTIDYSKQISKGSPLIFGGAKYPNIEHGNVWDQLSDVGATMIRFDFFPEYTIPNNTTIDDYRKNINNIQNSNNWNRELIVKIKNSLLKAKKLNLKIIGIVAYSPAWLTYSRSVHGVPKDWEIYEDITKKMYKLYRDDIDYVEIWNEPNTTDFLDVSNSSYSPQDAYVEIFNHAARAINEVDEELNDGKKILIGGPVAQNPRDTTFLNSLLRNQISKKYLDFISYHNYGTDEPSWDNFKLTLKQNKADNLPIFITEWNIDGKIKEDNPNKTSYPAILYTANKLVDFLKMGLSGANYYSFYPILPLSKAQWDGYLGFYRWENGKAELLPQAKTWRILSKQMKLGKGESAIFEAPLRSGSEGQASQGESALMGLVNDMLEPETLNTIGFKNIDGEYGVALVNSSDKSLVLETTLTNTTLKSFTKVRVYYASAGNDAKLPVYEGELKADKNGTIRFPFYIPRETVVGMVFAEDKAWYENIFQTSN